MRITLRGGSGAGDVRVPERRREGGHRGRACSAARHDAHATTTAAAATAPPTAAAALLENPASAICGAGPP